MEQNSSMERRVNEESLNLIRWKMNHTPWLGMSTGEVDIAVEEYRRFLVLKMENPAVTLAPSGIMDKAWHVHILDTRMYSEDCQAMFGRILHHRPSYDDDGRQHDLSLAFNDMSRLYSERFGHDPLDMKSGCNTDDDGSACTGVSCCDG